MDGIERTDPIPLERLRTYLTRERLPVLLKLQGEQVDSFLEMATEVTKKAMVEGWARGEYVVEIERLAGLFGANGWQSPYAEVWYNTYVLNAAYNEAQLEMVTRTSAGRLFPFLRLRTQRDERVRPSHRRVEGLTARPSWSGWSRWTPPLDWNCFLEGTVVSGRFIGGSKARYSGKAVDLQTSRGNRLRVTPNHPVLTTRGLIPASKVKKGDYLLGYRGDVELPLGLVGGLVDEKNPPTTVEKVFDALSSEAAGGAGFLYRPSNLDLHGDAKSIIGEVEVVGTYRKLSLQENPNLLEVVREGDLTGKYSGKVLVSGYGPPGSLLDGSLSTPSGLPSAGALSDDELAILLEQLPFQELRFGSASDIDALLAKPQEQGGSADGEFVRELLERYPGFVFLDECVNVEWFDFDGHVYDFESPLGWIVAENIFTSNCRCFLQKISWKIARLLNLEARIPEGSGIVIAY